MCACTHAYALSSVRLCNPMDYSLPGSSVILQIRILEWAAISFSRGSSRLGDRTQVSCIGRQTTTESPGKPAGMAVVKKSSYSDFGHWPCALRVSCGDSTE